jgi:hypothetical protein
VNQGSIPNVTPRPAATAPKIGLPQLVVGALIVLVVIFGLYKIFKHHESHAEHLAVVVTRALANNDMRPVESDFNAIRRPELANHAKVGRLSDFVNAKGNFKGLTEDTPAGSPTLDHHFIAHFSNGDLQERLELDEDGKIAKFDVRSLGSTSSSSE